MTKRSNTHDETDPVVRRSFERDDGVVDLSIFKPTLYPKQGSDGCSDDPWRCDYRILFPDGEIKQRHSVGIDGMQAMLLAIAGAKHAMEFVGDGTSSRRPAIRWLDADQLGLTISHFE